MSAKLNWKKKGWRNCFKYGCPQKNTVSRVIENKKIPLNTKITITSCRLRKARVSRLSLKENCIKTYTTTVSILHVKGNTERYKAGPAAVGAEQAQVSQCSQWSSATETKHTVRTLPLVQFPAMLSTTCSCQIQQTWAKSVKAACTEDKNRPWWLDPFIHRALKIHLNMHSPSGG